MNCSTNQNIIFYWVTVRNKSWLIWNQKITYHLTKLIRHLLFIGQQLRMRSVWPALRRSGQKIGHSKSQTFGIRYGRISSICSGSRAFVRKSRTFVPRYGFSGTSAQGRKISLRPSGSPLRSEPPGLRLIFRPWAPVPENPPPVGQTSEIWAKRSRSGLRCAKSSRFLYDRITEWRGMFQLDRIFRSSSLK